MDVLEVNENVTEMSQFTSLQRFFFCKWHHFDSPLILDSLETPGSVKYEMLQAKEPSPNYRLF